MPAHMCPGRGSSCLRADEAGGARSCGFAAGTLRGLAPAGVPLGGTQCAPSPEEDPKALPPMIPKKSQRKYGRKNIKTGPCTPAGASIFLTGRLLLQLCPAAHTGIKGQTVCQSLGIFPGQGPPAPPARGTGQIHAVFIPQPQNILQLHNGQIGHGGK